MLSLDERRVRWVRQRVVWDGRDDGGRLLPPGLYLCRVGLDVDAEGEQPIVAKLVASVY